MKITGPNPVRPATPAKKKEGVDKSSSSSDFMSLLAPTESAGASSAAPISDIQPPTSLNTLLTLQEMPDDELRDRKAFQHSKVTIETLEKLRDALLTGTIPSHLLSELQEIVHRSYGQVSDPGLRAIMKDIELRAAVELAKLERARS